VRLLDERACLMNASAFALNEVNVNEAQTSPDAAQPDLPFYFYPIYIPPVALREPS